MEKERRAVLAEAQMMNTIEYRVDCQLLQYLHAENALGSRFPIGKTDQACALSWPSRRPHRQTSCRGERWQCAEMRRALAFPCVAFDAAALLMPGNESQTVAQLARNVSRPRLTSASGCRSSSGTSMSCVASGGSGTSLRMPRCMSSVRWAVRRRKSGSSLAVLSGVCRPGASCRRAAMPPRLGTAAAAMATALPLTCHNSSRAH